MITSRKLIFSFSKFTLALAFIIYICKISVSNSCIIEDVRPLGCCGLSTDKEIQMFRTILMPSFSGLTIQKSITYLVLVFFVLLGVRIFVNSAFKNCFSVKSSNVLSQRIVQQDATIYSLLYFCKLLYMFRVVTSPIVGSTYNCNYSIWHWSNRLCYLPLWWRSFTEGSLMFEINLP